MAGTFLPPRRLAEVSRNTAKSLDDSLKAQLAEGDITEEQYAQGSVVVSGWLIHAAEVEAKARSMNIWE